MKLIKRFLVLVLFTFVLMGLFRAIISYKPKPQFISESVVAETWAAAAPKGDKLNVPPPPTLEDMPKTVRTVSVAPLFVPPLYEPRFDPGPAVIAQTEFPSLPQPKADKPAPKGDVCARHRMHREAYDNGRRWRCVK